MMKRVRPTEKDIRDVAWSFWERAERSLWVKEETKARARPRKGRPEGPGMGRAETGRGFESAQARPPGKKRERKRRERRVKRKRGMVRMEEVWGRKKKEEK